MKYDLQKFMEFMLKAQFEKERDKYHSWHKITEVVGNQTNIYHDPNMKSFEKWVGDNDLLQDQ